MNREFEARMRAARLAEVSRKVRTESMRVNADFAAIERDPDAEQETDPLQVEARKQRMAGRGLDVPQNSDSIGVCGAELARAASVAAMTG